jgi:hypothetical protein
MTGGDMAEFHHSGGSVCVAEVQKEVVVIDPELPENFDNTLNNERSPSQPPQSFLLAPPQRV